MKLRWILVVLTVAAIGVAGHFLFREQPPQNRSAPTKVTLRLKWLYDPGFAGELYAKSTGIFDKNGLSVDVRPGGFESDPIKLVASGADTIGVAGADSFLIARSQGIPIVAFAAGYIESPVVFYAMESSGVRGPKDFEGKRIGYQAGQDTATIYEALVKAVGVDRRKMSEIPVKYDFSPFLSGTLDVWPGYAATQSYVLESKRLAYRVIRPSEHGIRILGTVYFTTERFLQDNPHVIRAFVASLQEGWARVYREGSDATQVISAYDSTAMPLELVKFNLVKQADYIRPSGRSYGVFTDTDWQELEKVLKQADLLPATFSSSSAYTTAHLQAR